MEAGTKEILMENYVVRLQGKIALKSFHIFSLCLENRSDAVKKLREAGFNAFYLFSPFHWRKKCVT